MPCSGDRGQSPEGGGGGGKRYSKFFFTGKRHPFRIPFTEKRYPFHIPKRDDICLKQEVLMSFLRSV